MPMVDSLSKHPVCGSHNPRGGTPLYKLYRYVQTVQGRQRRGQSSGSVRSGIWRSTGRILTSTVVYEGLLWNRPYKGQTIHAGDLIACEQALPPPPTRGELNESRENARASGTQARDLKPSVTRVVIFPLSRVLLDGLRKNEGYS